MVIARTRSWLRNPAIRAALLVALATMAVAAFGVMARSTYGAQTSSDEPQYLLTALSLAEDFDLDIADEIESRAFEPFHEISLNTQTFPLNESGQRLSPHDPLLPLIAAPAMGIGGWVGVRILLVAIGGLTAAITTWTAVRRLGLRPRVAVVGVGSIMVSAPIVSYSTQVFPEILAALAVSIAASALLHPRLEQRHLVLVAVSVVALPWLSVKYAPVAAVITLIAIGRLLRSGRRQTTITLLSVLAASGIVYLAVHQRIYGGWTVYSTGDHFIDDGEFAVVGTSPNYVGRSRRLAGLLVDRRFGLIPWAPIWAMAPLAVAALAARWRRLETTVILAPIAAGWLVATFVALTMHGWWSPGRQIVVIVPLVALAVARYVDRSARRLAVAATLGFLGAVNWVWLAIEASTDRRALIVDFYDTAALPYRAIAWMLPDSWPQRGDADWLLAIWTVVLVVSMAIAFVRARGADDDATPKSESDSPIDEAGVDQRRVGTERDDVVPSA